jgi:hypothetical protein
MSHDKDKNVVIRLEVLVPHGGPAVVIREERLGPVHFGNTPNISIPPTGNPNQRARNGVFICAVGSNAIETVGSVNQAAVRVHAFPYIGIKSMYDISNAPESGSVSVIPETDGDWDFGLNNTFNITLTQLGQHTLAVWAEYSGPTFQKSRAEFIAVTSDQTECTPGYYFGGLAAQSKRRAGATAHRWKFTLVGVGNLGCNNCGALNAAWVLERDHAQPHPERWLASIPQSFADRDQHAWWRLQHCPRSGNWHLDCVQLPSVPLGVWISYVCHESRWLRGAANRMTLHTHSGYCVMPPEITIEPALHGPP